MTSIKVMPMLWPGFFGNRPSWGVLAFVPKNDPGFMHWTWDERSIKSALEQGGLNHEVIFMSSMLNVSSASGESAKEVAVMCANALKQIYPDCEVKLLPTP